MKELKSPFANVTVVLDAIDANYPADSKVDAGKEVLGYDAYYNRSVIGQGKMDIGIEGSLSSLMLTNVTLLSHPLGLHVDTIDTSDLGHLAWAIASYGGVEQIGSALMNASTVTAILGDLIPTGNIRNNLKPTAALTTFEVLMASVARRISESDLGAKGGYTRNVVVALSSLFKMILAPAVMIQQSRPITLTKVSGRMLPNREELEVAVLSINLKKLLDEMISLIVSTVKPGAFGPISQSLQIGCAKLGEAMIRISERAQRARIALQLVSWQLQSISKPGFPDELRSERSLLTLTSNATIVLLALQEKELAIPVLPSVWREALNDVEMALSQTRSFKTITLAEFQSGYGHYHITGAANRLLAVLAYGNLAGSGQQMLAFPIQMGTADGIVELIPSESATRALGTATGSLLNASGSTFIQSLAMYLQAAVMQDATQSKEKSFTSDTRFERVFMTEDELVIYALTLTRSVIPTLVNGRIRLHYLIDATQANANFAQRQVGGVIRTDDPREVIATCGPRDATMTLTTQTDTIPKPSMSTLLFKDQIPIIRSFNGAKVDLKLHFVTGGTIEFTIPKFLHLFSINPGIEIIISTPTRTKYMLEVIDRMLDGAGSDAKADSSTKLAYRIALSLKGLIMGEWVGGSTISTDVFEGLVRRAAAVGPSERSAAILTDASRSVFQLESAATIGSVILQETGIMDRELAKKWLSQLVKGDWAFNRSLGSSPKVMS